MPTTFTSLLGLSLPATGELAGTWGDTVNNGITSLLDNAIAGTTTLSTDANVTLTTTTGAANQARQAILLCTGARTAQRTITAPAQSKTYTLINATTGGFAVQLVGAGPTTGITVVSGERALVAWNGSDFVKVASNLVTGTATRIPFFDASGLLSSAADFVRDASGNVGIGRTPSGSAVVDVQSAAAGILRIRGGTGTNQGSSVYGTVGSDTTTWAIGARATIYGGTPGNDSAIYTLGSLSLGTNGIPDRVLIDMSGNVGIGTTSPATRLDVQGSSVRLLSGVAANFAFYDLGTNAARVRLGAAGAANDFLTGSAQNDGLLFTMGSNALIFGTNQAERMRIDASGNVGIGFSASLPTAASGGTASAGLFAARSQLVAHQTSMGVLQFSSVSNLTQLRSYGATSGTGAIAFQVGGGGGSADFEAVRIDSSGNVGISAVPGAWSAAARVLEFTFPTFGMDGPGQAFVSFNAREVSAGSWVYKSTDTAQLFRSSSGGWAWSTAASGTAGNAITFTERMRIDASGNVGIGTASPRVPGGGAIGLTLNGSTTGFVDVNTNGTRVLTLSGFGNDAFVTNPTAAGVLILQTNNTERLRIDSSGNVGIGTTSPAAKLDVRGTNSVLSAVASDESGNSIMDTRNSNAANAVQFFVAHLGSQVLMGNARANALQLWTNGAERMRITSTGNIVAGASAALATTATDGFLYVPTCAGTPTGTPTAITGMAPIVVNTTNNKLYFYSGGAWRDAGP